jgi:RNA polymerase sigma factor (sigma-70 family)
MGERRHSDISPFEGGRETKRHTLSTPNTPPPKDWDMEPLAPPEQDARARLTQDQAQQLVLRTVTTQAESLLRTAYRHSLCDDDAHDAYQRSMEIFLRRARTLDPASVHKWLHVVVKHEAIELRRGRTATLGFEEVDLEHHTSPHSVSPEEHVLGADRTTRATEALKRLKPQERRAMWLKALGHSYAEISAATGFSATKVNRCLREGRKSFLERFEGIESGVECERWQPMLSAIADGTATAAQLTEARPHLRNCPACRATLRGEVRSRRPLAAMLPVGLVGFVERFLPGVAGAEAAGTGAGAGAGVLGVSGAKLAALLVAGATATAGGGLVVAHETRHVAAHSAAPRVAPRAAVALPRHAVTTPAVTVTAARPDAPPRTSKRARPRSRPRVVAHRRPTTARVEFVPRGAESRAPRPPARAVRATAAGASAPKPLPAPSQNGADTSRGEFSPQP